MRWQNAKSVIILTDKSGRERALQRAREALEQGLPVEMHILGGDYGSPEASASVDGVPVRGWEMDDVSSGRLTQHVMNLPMGTRIHVCAAFSTIRQAEAMLEQAGFGDEERSAEPVGDPRHALFCAGCHGLNPAAPTNTVHCIHCGRRLAVSDHYSKRINAVLGYVVIPEQMPSQAEVTNAEDS